MVKFDVNLSIGRWPFRPLPHAEIKELVPYLAGHGIEGGLLRSAEGAFSSDPEAENETLLKRCKGYKNFIPLLIANPFYKSFRQWNDVPAAVLYPGFQRFSLTAPETIAMAETLGSQGTKILVVVMREEDERAQHPLCKIPAVPVESLESFAQALPGMTVIALNAYVGEALRFTAPNLFCDTAFIEGFPALAPLAAKEKCGKLLFGTHAPFLCASAGVSKVAALDEKNRSAMSETLRNIFRHLI